MMQLREQHFDVIEIPEDMKEEARKYRALLIEEVASYDENLLEKFMEDEDSITEEEVHSALRAAVMDMAIIPMICGSAFKNKGVQFLVRCCMSLLTFSNGQRRYCWYKSRDR